MQNKDKRRGGTKCIIIIIIAVTIKVLISFRSERLYQVVILDILLFPPIVSEKLWRLH